MSISPSSAAVIDRSGQHAPCAPMAWVQNGVLVPTPLHRASPPAAHTEPRFRCITETESVLEAWSPWVKGNFVLILMVLHNGLRKQMQRSPWKVWDGQWWNSEIHLCLRKLKFFLLEVNDKCDKWHFWLIVPIILSGVLWYFCVCILNH